MMKRIVVLFVFLQVFGYCLAQSEDDRGLGALPVLQQFVGCWHPNISGWHGDINITVDGDKMCLVMTTDEGEKRFNTVIYNPSEPSIKWSYGEESDALWYIGKWRETNRDEILIDVNHINASCGVPTEIYRIGIEANHSVKEWKYIAFMVNGKLVVNYGYKWDFFSPSNEKLFMKSERFLSPITYVKYD